MELDAKIYIAGHKGMVGSAILRTLKKKGYLNLVYRTHSELDLTNQKEVESFFEEEQPEYVFLAAAKVGGIAENIKMPADFLMQNLLIQCHVINSAYQHQVKKLLFLGSSCIYPKEAQQPLKEEALLTGLLEPTNEGYAVAKIAGLKLCEYYKKQYHANFISVMPCNLYGYEDNFEEETSHLVPALIRRFHEAKIQQKEFVTVWGTGKVYRELLFTEEMAEACLYVMNHYEGETFLNLGYGEDFTVLEIAEIIKKVVGYKGKIQFDSSKPEGMVRKIVDSSKLRQMGWSPQISLEEGIRSTYDWYVKHLNKKVAFETKEKRKG